MKTRLLALLVSISLCAAGAARAVEFCELMPVSPQSQYQEVFQPTCHNCYEIDVALQMGARTFKEVLNSVKNVEIDFWDTRDGASGGVAHEWYVRHSAGTLFQSGNDNNCTGNGDGTNNLGACLTDVKQWSDAHPGHDPITLFLDKKQDWSSVNEGRRPVDLDNLVESKLGSALYKPASLQGSFTTLRDAARRREWPSMGVLAGKVIVVLTGGELANHNATLSEYVQDRRGAAALFVAADTDEKSDIDGVPEQFTQETANYVVFYNIEDTDGRDSLGKTTRVNNYVSRLWNGDDHNPCAILANCINDNGLKKWNTGACSGQSAGTLKLLDPADWLPEQKESASNFACPSGTVMTGRWHNCKNKGEKCDENGNSTVYCTNIEANGVLFGVGAGTWSGEIKESDGTSYLCPTDKVMTGRQHQGDENGKTKYQCSPLSYQGRAVPVNPNAGSWSAEIVESTSQFVCPDGQILNGRYHKGDENGKTKYHCIPVPNP
jgi:calcium-dependent phosphoinositide phospholipase C